MKVFIAAKIEDKEKIDEIVLALEEHQHTIHLKWWELIGSGISAETYAVRNADAVYSCDVLIAYMEIEYIYRCQLVEIGMAAVQDIPIFIIGEEFDDCIFKHYPTVRVCDSIDEAVAEVNKLSERE